MRKLDAVCFCTETVAGLDEIPELPARLNRLTLSVSRDWRANSFDAPLDAAYDDACTAPPEFGGACPVALREIECSQVVERVSYIRVVGPSTFSQIARLRLYKSSASSNSGRVFVQPS